MYLLKSQGAQNYEVQNVLLNLLFGALTFVSRKHNFSSPVNKTRTKTSKIRRTTFYRTMLYNFIYCNKGGPGTIDNIDNTGNNG